MSDIIQLLPDHVANQIAAGEVIQRPSSVVKELVENALDSGATEIKIIIKDAGRTLIQVVDNGCGMSNADALAAFERHATSKIKSATDLFNLRTMGFRGEALASIASVAHVELKTTLSGQDMGLHVVLEGGKLEKKEPIRCPVGANFMVKNLFYNIPVRRKFLKPDTTELAHITTEIYRVALVHPQIAFVYLHNEQEICNVMEESMINRIGNLLGKKLYKQLVRVDADTSLVKITGYVGVLSSVKKRRGEQFFFVNNRYMNHPYFHRAVIQAYDQLIPTNTFPPYFLHFELDPSSIDVNIHPTKTEIKFEEESAIWAILVSAIREALGKSNEQPSIDFDQADQVVFPLYDAHREVKPPQIKINYNYNPFKNETAAPSTSNASENNRSYFDSLPLVPESKPEAIIVSTNLQTFFQFKGKYILTPSKSGMMLIHQHRAHFRILYEQYMREMLYQAKSSQRLLFPEELEVDKREKHLVEEYQEDFKHLGFDLVAMPDQDCLLIEAVPSDFGNKNPAKVLNEILGSLLEEENDLKQDAQKILAKQLARVSAIKAGDELTILEMSELFDQLFACEVQIFSPDGKTIVTIIENELIEQRFK